MADMNDPKPTHRLDMEDAEMLEAMLKQQEREHGTATLGTAHEVLLLIDNGIQRLSVRNEMTFLLGRFSRSKPRANHIDLAPFGAQDRGVSRIHAQIHMDDNRLYLTDLDSTNGTIVDGVRLLPHHPKLLRQGSEVVLGRLAIQVMYKSRGDN